MKIENKYLPDIEISQNGLVAIEAALVAGNAIRKAVGGKVSKKEGMSNVVNEADLASGVAIRKLILRNFPDDQILSEDPPIEQPEVKAPLTIKRLWVVDELDGSKNFADGIDNVWVSIAFVENGEVKAGACYNPILDRLYLAEKNKGAYFIGKAYGSDEWVKTRLFLSDQTDLNKATIETSISYDLSQTIEHEAIKLGLFANGLTPRIREIGSSVEQLCRVAAGNSDLQFHGDLKPWDYAAASLIVAESGGVIKRMDGSEFNFMCPDGVAGNEKIVDEFISQVSMIKADERFQSYFKGGKS